MTMARGFIPGRYSELIEEFVAYSLGVNEGVVASGFTPDGVRPA